MKDLTTENGDLTLINGDFSFVSDKELLKQKSTLVLGTNQGEWEADAEQGINFRVILKKLYNEDEILGTIRQGIKQVDPTFEITEFELVPEGDRHYTINFTAVNADGKTITNTVRGG